MKKETFLKRVIEEIETIKLKATDKEKSKLDFASFDKSMPALCIYGQMTGDCFSDRAKELFPKEYANLIPSEAFKQNDFKKGNNYTYLEKYLFYCEKSEHKIIIDYIKGASNELNITL